MRRALALLLVLAGLVALWTALGPGRSSRRPSIAPAEPCEAPAGTELSPPAVLPAAHASAAGDEGLPAARRERPALARNAPPEIRREPVRGRVVVAETGDPIEAALALRLRTLDLRTSESLVTRPDGSFAGRVEFPRARLLALVKNEEGRELVDHEAPFDPASTDEWLVRVPGSSWPTFATGRVVDGRGTPLDEAEISLIGLEPERPFAEGRSDGEGAFRLERLRAGPYRLQVQGAWSRAVVDVTLRSGPNELGDCVLPEPEGADVVVELVLEEADSWPEVWLELRAAGSSAARRYDAAEAEEAGAGRYRLRLPRIPAGRYALTPHAFDGRTYEPARVTLSPPATVELRGSGKRGAGTLFRARDARSGEPLLGFGVFGRYGRTWALHQAVERVSLGAIHRNVPAAEVRLRPGFEAWVVFTGSHRAAMGTFAGAGATIEVALEPAWCELFQFEDGEGDTTGPLGQQHIQDPPVLAGVEVYVDGALAGASDERGFFLLAREREPETLEYRLPGWRVVGESSLMVLNTLVLVRTR